MTCNGKFKIARINPLDTASYRLAKYLAKNLSPLGQSTYTIKSTFNFMGKIKNKFGFRYGII